MGRPDLLAGTGLTPEEMARQLYRSLRDKLLTLPDDTRVIPAHGAGSACGRQLSTARQSTIGEQRHTNYALAPMTEDEFVRIVTDGQPTTPLYFSYDAMRNRQVHPLLGEHEPPGPLSLDEVLDAQGAGAAILDARMPDDFAAGHLPGSVNVGLGGRFAEYAGDVVSPDSRIVLVCEPGHELEAKVRLGRIGFDGVVGHLDDPVKAFLDRPEAMAQASRLTTDELALRRADVDPAIVDVRNPGETANGTIPGAVTIPLARLVNELDRLDPTRRTVVYCAGGYRSSIGASVLRARGFVDVSDLLGGYGAWAARR